MKISILNRAMLFNGLITLGLLCAPQAHAIFLVDLAYWTEKPDSPKTYAKKLLQGRGVFDALIVRANESLDITLQNLRQPDDNPDKIPNLHEMFAELKAGTFTGQANFAVYGTALQNVLNAWKGSYDTLSSKILAYHNECRQLHDRLKTQKKPLTPNERALLHDLMEACEILSTNTLLGHDKGKFSVSYPDSPFLAAFENTIVGAELMNLCSEAKLSQYDKARTLFESSFTAMKRHLDALKNDTKISSQALNPLRKDVGTLTIYHHLFTQASELAVPIISSSLIKSSL
jgi:hypothetical protein